MWEQSQTAPESADPAPADSISADSTPADATPAGVADADTDEFGADTDDALLDMPAIPADHKNNARAEI